jgi:hypothetical protein
VDDVVDEQEELDSDDRHCFGEERLEPGVETR